MTFDERDHEMRLTRALYRANTRLWQGHPVGRNPENDPNPEDHEPRCREHEEDGE